MCPFDDEEWCEANEAACTGEGDEGDPATCGTNFAAKCEEAGNEDHEGCAEVEEWCSAGDPGGDDAWDEWDTAFCGGFNPEEEVVEEEVVEEEVVEEETTEEETTEEVTEEDVEEAADEVPGFGLLSAVAAISAVLLLRRRL